MIKNNWLMFLSWAILLAGGFRALGNDAFGPWSVSGRVPVVEPGARTPAPMPEAHSIGRDYCFQLLYVYQNYFSVVVVSHCPMRPSCSNYSIAAIRKHGPLIGIPMTADRLYHEGDEMPLVPTVKIGGRLCYLDPVENNDFWWCKR